MDKTQFKFADLDFVPFLDVHEITGHLPVVLSDSPILYSYMMMIHLTRIQHAGVNITVKTVSNKINVCTREIRSSCKETQDGLLQVQNNFEKDFRIANG